MEALRAEGTVTADALEFIESRNSDGAIVTVNLRGRVFCANGGVLVVNKWLEVRYSNQNRLEARTREYMYEGLVPDDAGRLQERFRYDNCHGGLATLHCHVFDGEGRITQVRQLAHEELPYLNEIIRETNELETP